MSGAKMDRDTMKAADDFLTLTARVQSEAVAKIENALGPAMLRISALLNDALASATNNGQGLIVTEVTEQFAQQLRDRLYPCARNKARRALIVTIIDAANSLNGIEVKPFEFEPTELRTAQEVSEAFAAGRLVEVRDPQCHQGRWVRAHPENPDSIRRIRIAEGFRYRAL